ncbi:hypothetical protein EBV26_20100 [bacterium]|jgi:hypothetical protein|nr:hypothetical protein [bacterium]
MTTFRNQTTDSYSLGSTPPEIRWTIVRGDSAAFRVYVTDDERNPLLMEDWQVDMDIYRPSTDDVILSLEPQPIEFQDSEGSFTVSLTSVQSEILETGDVFDIQLTELDSGTRVWTVAKGSLVVIEDITE